MSPFLIKMADRKSTKIGIYPAQRAVLPPSDRKSHITCTNLFARIYTRAHSRRRQRDSHYIFTHLLCSIPMPYTSVGLEYRFSIHFGRTKQKNGDELRTLRSLRTSQTDPSKIDRAYGTCVNFFSLVADPTNFFPLKVAR